MCVFRSVVRSPCVRSLTAGLELEMMRSDPAEQWFVTHGVRQRHLEDSVPLSQLGQVEEKATVKFAESRSS